MLTFALQTVAAPEGRVEALARTFGVDWVHLTAQTISFAIVCLILYSVAYKPILRMLDTRRQQIADGLANAEKVRSELARIETDRRDVLAKAEAAAKELIEQARGAAAQAGAEETRKAMEASERVFVRVRERAERDHARMLAELKQEVGRLVVDATAAVTGKVLTATDQRRLAAEAARYVTGDENHEKSPAGGTPAVPPVHRR